MKNQKTISNQKIIEQRLQKMKDFYNNVDEMIDNFPLPIPEKYKIELKSSILCDEDLKNLIKGIESHRLPRIFLIGRTGVGKSSLINALIGSYMAKVSDTVSCTADTKIYTCMDGDRPIMEILDTRGIAESESLNDKNSAEEALINDISNFSPDVAIFMLNCTHRDDVNEDVKFIKEVAKQYYETNRQKLPIVVVVNKCDEMAPARVKTPTEYTEKKVAKIDEVVQYYKRIIVKNDLEIKNIIPISSLIDWQTADGIEVSSAEIEDLPKSEIEELQIAFDGRYRIEELLDILEESIFDYEAKMGLRMAARLDEVIRRLAKHMNKIFSGLAGTIALMSIPVSDIYILVILQSCLVLLIASLSGRDVSVDTAKEFILSLGGVACMGYTFKLIAQEGTKLLSFVFPGLGTFAGSAVGFGMATQGTKAIGDAAIAYYIDNKKMDRVKEKFNDCQKENMNA